MNDHLKILILEDSPCDVDLIERELKRGGIRFTSVVVDKKDDFEKALKQFKPDVILSDHALPQYSSIEALQSHQQYQKESGALVPFILISGVVSEEFAVQCFKAGADDYIMKDRLKRLPLSIESALEKCRIENERQEYLRQVLAKEALMNEAEHLAQFGSWDADLRTGKHTWSDETYNIYGYAPGEITPSYEFFLNMVHPDDIASLKNDHKHALANVNSFENEFRIIDKKGNLKFISGKLKIIRDKEGQPIRLVGFNLDITERKRGETQLQKSEQEYKSLFDQNPDAIFSLDLKGRFTRVNKGLARLTGLSVSELQGMDFRNFVHKIDLQRVYLHYLSALEGKPQRYEAKLIDFNGKIITLDVTNMPIVVNDEIIGVHGVAKDITEKKQMEGFVNRVNRLACIGGWEFDIIQQKLSWTSITKELHEVGPDFDPDIETGIRFYKDGTNRETIRRAVVNGIEKGTPWDLELKIITAKGNERWIRSIGEAEIKDGKCIRLYGSFQDIHLRKQAEETLKEAYLEKVKILERVGDAFFAVDDEWTVTYWNNIAETELGMPREAVVGKNLWEVYGDAIPLAFYTQYHKAMDENITVHFEEYYPARDIWIEVSAYPSASGLSVYFRNVTDKKKYIREIENQNIQLMEIGWIQSHEVRAPLARIMGLISLVKDEKVDLSFLLDNIVTSAHELDGLIRRIVKKTEVMTHTEIKNRGHVC